jgi:anti-sigma regulatory factor (Ser/Thr protein kinase)
MPAPDANNIRRQESADRLSLHAPGYSASLAHIRDTVTDIARRTGFPEDEVAKIEMAVGEACENVVEHAYAPGKKWYSHTDPELRLEIRREDDKLVIEIHDHGSHFDLANYQPPPIEEGIRCRRTGGFGLAIIRQFMDEVQFTSRAETGNTLRLVKYLKKS